MTGADGYTRLAFEVVRLAVNDARRGNMGAREWLQSKDAEIYLDAFGLEPAWVDRWIRELETPARGKKCVVEKPRNTPVCHQEGLQGAFLAQNDS